MAIELGSPFDREGATRWSPRGMTRENISLLGIPDVARIDGGGFWVAELSAVVLSQADHIRAWRALEALLDGGVTEVVVPSCESRTAPWPVVDGVKITSYGSIPHSDGTLFSDGSGYYQPVIDCEVVSAANLRATSLVLSFNYGGPLRGGEAFSLEHPTKGHRRYHVGSVVINDSGQSVVTIRPPLREAVAADTPVNFDRPKCTMRLAASDAMDLTLEMRRFARPSVAFKEAPF